MQSILTQCPRCQTSFKVSDKQLEIAEGFVRCGSCLDVFSALSNRITLKQPASTTPPVDVPEDALEDETGAQTLEDKPASPSEITATTTGAQAITSSVEAFDLSYSGSMQYPVSQLVDADDVIPVNIAADVYTSSFTNDDSGFVFDDDIPLGNMVLDDTDLDAGNEFEIGNDDDKERETTGEFEDEADSDSAAVYEEYTEADAEGRTYIDDIDAEITRPERVLRQARTDIAPGYDDALMADDPGSTFDEEFHDEDETILLQLDADFTVEGGGVAGFVEDAVSDEKVNCATTSIAADTSTNTEVDAEAAESIPPANAQFAPEPALSPVLQEKRPGASGDGVLHADHDGIPEPAQDSPQHPLNDVNVTVFGKAEAVAEREAHSSAFAKSVGDIEADAIFHSIYDPAFAADTEPGIGAAAADQSRNTPVNQEALYDAYAAGIPAEAGAEEPHEIMVQGFAAIRDDNNSLDAADSFTAANFSHHDEFQADGFSALAVDAADKAEEFVALSPEAPPRYGKEELREYLAGLEDADALEPLPAATMDAIEDEPLTLEVARSLRRYISTFGWFCLSLALVAVFLFQLAANNLELMQQSPVYARYLPLFCRVLDCPAPAPVTAGIESLYSQDLLVRSHPRIADALEVSFIFRNDAELPQPFPLVELNFRDNNKRLMANRLFKPEEYLPPELTMLDMMPARSSVQVMLELADPGSEAVDYEIILRDAP